ncbi:MAG: alpha/beta fold hydrolase [Planctomycetota bacterium]
MPDADRFTRLPRALEERTIIRRLASDVTPFDDGGIPALLAHPDEGWHQPGAAPTPRPVVLWLHGRTVSKELDPGRYLRWQRAGIATCAIDLPGHGDRLEESLQGPGTTLQIVRQCAQEIDLVLDALRNFNGAFDLERVAIGGMSAGGMVVLHRLCSDHPFVCASVEGTGGDFRAVLGERYDDTAAAIDPSLHLDGWRTIPLQALHSEADEWMPFEGIRAFVDRVRQLHASRSDDDSIVELHSWPETGAPAEHIGFGRFSNDAKNLQRDFYQRWLSP